MKHILTFILLCFVVSIGFSQNRSSSTKVDVSNADKVQNYITGKTFFAEPNGDYGLYFSFDYSSFSNNYAMIVWNKALSKSDPAGVFINVDFTPSYTRCRISGMEMDNGMNLNLFLYPDGHIETDSGRVLNQVK
jgi:hypothetical protein